MCPCVLLQASSLPRVHRRGPHLPLPARCSCIVSASCLPLHTTLSSAQCPACTCPALPTSPAPAWRKACLGTDLLSGFWRGETVTFPSSESDKGTSGPKKSISNRTIQVGGWGRLGTLSTAMASRVTAGYLGILNPGPNGSQGGQHASIRGSNSHPALKGPVLS